jgi:hypothetical protein
MGDVVTDSEWLTELERGLWSAADELGANSKLRASELLARSGSGRLRSSEFVEDARIEIRTVRPG